MYSTIALKRKKRGIIHKMVKHPLPPGDRHCEGSRPESRSNFSLYDYFILFKEFIYLFIYLFERVSEREGRSEHKQGKGEEEETRELYAH